MQVKLAESRGFCFGVEDAIELAEQVVAERGAGNLIALGPVIHNKQVVERLEEAGLNQSGDLESVPQGSTVLIRSHGAAPETLARAEERSLNVVDATCVLVKRAQNVVRQLHEEGYQVVLIGDRDHPEVKGVIGYAPDVIVVDDKTDLDEALARRPRLGIVAQTTLAPEHVGAMVGKICNRNFKEMKIVNTLCMEVVHRQEAAVALCQEVDVVFVLGGLHSANTQELARLCREQGVDTHHLETWDQFRPEMAAGKKMAGVTAGASTPEWVIADFVEQLEAFEQ
ncbi:MAG TPA: 4-hydroxy-3-methylbut-2-enyl diphosphate reductase [Phycisphaerae bacterium]|nr:4-hydroxy-3-methylbut-2-enyl diphosphate reductase [Phycisphaerae bacterium]